MFLVVILRPVKLTGLAISDLIGKDFLDKQVQTTIQTKDIPKLKLGKAINHSKSMFNKLDEVYSHKMFSVNEKQQVLITHILNILNVRSCTISKPNTTNKLHRTEA